MPTSDATPRDRSFEFDPPRAFAACTVALGAVVLAGWTLGRIDLTRLFPGMIAMKPNAALAFVLAGLALWSIREGRPPSRRAVGLSLAVAAIGGATLVEYLAGVDLGIDRPLPFAAMEQLGGFPRWRMHPTTAFDLVILGTASALLAADREARAAQGLVLIAMAVAGSTLVGYLYGVREFVGLAAYHQMALPTTLAVIALAVGLLLSRPGQGLTAAITDPGPGGMTARRLLPVAVLAPITVCGLAIIARDLGLFDERYSTAVRVTALIVVFVACVWRSAASLHRVERERRRVEHERLEGQRRFRFLADSMPQIVWTSGPDGAIESFNRRWFDYTGQDPEPDPAAGWDWPAAIHPDERPGCLRDFDRHARSGEPYQGEHRILRRDGVYRWHLVRAEPMRDEAGRVVQWIGTATDVDDQKRRGEERYRSLVEATAAIVWSIPSSGVFESDQPRWAAFTGQTFEQYKGWGWIDAIHPEDRESTARAWTDALRAGSVYQQKQRVRRHDGEYRYMIVKAVPLIGEDGAVGEWIGVHTDVDAQERAHEAMRLAKEAAEAATRAKSEFLANMSHEIRTPMNGVLGMTELALGTDLDARQREYLGLVKSSADALLTVIDDILDFSKIEAGKLALEPIPFSLVEVTTDALRCLAPRAHAKGLELACRIAPGTPPHVVGDPGRFRQVLTNLVGNAVKFTESGEVVVTVEPDEAEGLVRVSVLDTGVGVAPEKREAIFAPFQQADGSTTRKYGGTGLGLTISARLIALMGGRIWVEANPAPCGGSVFRFTARLAPFALAAADRAPSTAAEPVVLDGLRVLIVDDNRTNRMILDEVLSQWGCRPLAVEGGPEALQALDRASSRGEPFALILLDQMMPGMDGRELARRVGQDPRHASTPMLMLTSAGRDDDPSALRALGVGGRLDKPVRQSDLLNAVLELLGPAVKPTAAPAVPGPVDSGGRRLRVLLAEDHPVNQKVATRMLEAQGHHVVVACDGRRALDAMAESGPFDVVLMDVAMPVMDGFEALAAIRTREQLGEPHTPVVALTAHAMKGDRDRCLSAGFDAYLAKPIRASALAEALEQLAAPPVLSSTA